MKKFALIGLLVLCSASILDAGCGKGKGIFSRMAQRKADRWSRIAGRNTEQMPEVIAPPTMTAPPMMVPPTQMVQPKPVHFISVEEEDNSQILIFELPLPEILPEEDDELPAIPAEVRLIEVKKATVIFVGVESFEISGAEIKAVESFNNNPKPRIIVVPTNNKGFGYVLNVDATANEIQEKYTCPGCACGCAETGACTCSSQRMTAQPMFAQPMSGSCANGSCGNQGMMSQGMMSQGMRMMSSGGGCAGGSCGNARSRR